RSRRVWQTSTRLLQLLAMLQARRGWSGCGPGSPLGGRTSTARGARRSAAAPGVGGGARPSTGTTMPPLLLDDEEVVAVAVALRTTAGAGVSGIEEASLRALVQLEQLLPTRLRHRIDAVRTAT